MKTQSGKAYFRAIGQHDASTGANVGTACQYAKWPAWARVAYTDGWVDQRLSRYEAIRPLALLVKPETAAGLQFPPPSSFIDALRPMPRALPGVLRAPQICPPREAQEIPEITVAMPMTITFCLAPEEWRRLVAAPVEDIPRTELFTHEEPAIGGGVVRFTDSRVV